MFDASALSRSDPSPHMSANSHGTIALVYRAEKVIRAYSVLTKQTHQTDEEKTHVCDWCEVKASLTQPADHNQETPKADSKCISVTKNKKNKNYLC